MINAKRTILITRASGKTVYNTMMLPGPSRDKGAGVGLKDGLGLWLKEEVVLGIKEGGA